MKTRNTLVTAVLCAVFALAGAPQAEAQIWKKLKKKAEDAATRKLEDKTKEETEKAMDTILGNDGGTNSGGSTENTGGSDNGDTSTTGVEPKQFRTTIPQKSRCTKKVIGCQEKISSYSMILPTTRLETFRSCGTPKVLVNLLH